MSRQHVIVEVFETLARYIGGRLLISAALGVIFTFGFWAVGVPLWFLAGPLCGLINLVPFAGSVLGVIVPVTFVALAGKPWQVMVGAVAVFAAGQILEALVLTPRILGTALQLRPLVVFAAVIVGSWAFGPIGAILSVPVVAVLYVIYRRRSEAAPPVSGPPAPRPPVSEPPVSTSAK